MAARRAIAALVDAALVALLGYLGFRVAVPLAGCRDLASCPPLTPLIAIAALAFIALYFLIAHAFWRRTFGQRLLSISEESGKSGLYDR
jgi:hypothetical protein